MNKDIYLNIFLYCDYQSLIHLKLTCKDINQSLEENYFWYCKYKIDNLPLINNNITNWKQEYCYLVKIANIVTDKLNHCQSSYYHCTSLSYNVKHICSLPLYFQNFITKYKAKYIVTSISITWYYNPINKIYHVICTLCGHMKTIKTLIYNKDDIVFFLLNLFYYEYLGL